MKNRLKGLSLFSIIVLVTSFTVFADDIRHPPSEHKGLTVTGKNSLPLGKQIPALNGYEINVRTVTMAPGAVVKNHGHKTRPGAFYVVKGKVTEYRGNKSAEISAGQVVLEDYDTDHWVVNNGEEAILFVFDIIPDK